MKAAAVRMRAKPPVHARRLLIIMAKHSQVCPSPYGCIQLNKEQQRPSIVHTMVVMSGSDQQPWLKRIIVTVLQTGMLQAPLLSAECGSFNLLFCATRVVAGAWLCTSLA